MKKTSIWQNKLRNIEPIKDIKNLPYYGFLFFFKNTKNFRLLFFILSLISIVSTISLFLNTLLLGDLISNINNLSLKKIFSFYLILYASFALLSEMLDYFIRKYAEAFPTIYTDHLRIRFYKTIIFSSFANLFNFSKEKLNALVDKYISSVNVFLNDWFWGTIRKMTDLVIILIILYIQNPLVLVINLAYLIFFLLVSLRTSIKFSPIAKEYSERVIESTSIERSFTLNLNTVKRVGITQYFIKILRHYVSKNWNKFEKVRKFHANRWFIQLNLFRLIYIATLFFGVYQVKSGSLPLGFLVLIYYAYSRLLGILIYIIEYYVGLVQQKEDTKIIHQEFSKILSLPIKKQTNMPKEWEKIKLMNISCSFKNPKGQEIKIEIPNLEVEKGEKVGITGESGQGKTTLFHILLNLTNYTGIYKIDSIDAQKIKFSPYDIGMVTNIDPLFNISVEENITLGRKIAPKKIKEILEGTRVLQFTKNLKVKVGDIGTNFSAGQLQRIRLARGLIQNSDIYLLDEPFNGIDKQNKKAIINYLKDFFKNKTVILITHTKEELALVDRVYKFSNYVLKETAYKP